MYEPSNNTNFAGNCTNFGNRLTIPFSQSDFASNEFYYVVLKNLRNPDLTSCDPNKWVISFSNAVGDQIKARSHSTYFNTPLLPFTKNPSQINLKYVNSLDGKEISVLDIYSGMFFRTLPLALATDYGAFVRSFSLYAVPAKT